MKKYKKSFENKEIPSFLNWVAKSISFVLRFCRWGLRAGKELLRMFRSLPARSRSRLRIAASLERGRRPSSAKGLPASAWGRLTAVRDSLARRPRSAKGFAGGERPTPKQAGQAGFAGGERQAAQ